MPPTRNDSAAASAAERRRFGSSSFSREPSTSPRERGRVRDPGFGIFHAPFIVADAEGAVCLLEGEVRAESPDRISGFGPHGWPGHRRAAGGFPAVDDLGGAQIRAMSPAHGTDFWIEFGAAPAPVPVLYDAFTTSQGDAMRLDYEGEWNSGYWGHAGTIRDSRHMMFPMAAASGRKWGAMFKDDHAIVPCICTAKPERMPGTDRQVLTVDQNWFGLAMGAWSEEWREMVPLLPELVAEAAQ